MSCPFYWYNHHYACRKTGQDVNEDTYYKYCRNYDYDDCPIYKGNDSGGCFLTSACTEARGLPDDCHELTVLRAFRDGYLRSQPEPCVAMIERGENVEAHALYRSYVLRLKKHYIEKREK